MERYMREPKRHAPFQLLGSRLKNLREDHHESIAEVSGAVEIDPEVLERIEQGEECPIEEVLMLLINHFGLSEHEAMQLWEAAGYEQPGEDKRAGPESMAKNVMVFMALDSRVLLSDETTVTAGKGGVILNFHQPNLQGQQVPISRIGMNYEQAETLLQKLQHSVLQKRYMPNRRLLPPGTADQQ